MMRINVLAAVFALGLFSTSANSFDVTVQTSQGAVRGSGTDVKAFKGIPYAAPPVRSLRWHPPEPPNAWQGVRDATAFGATCPQPHRPTAPPSNEDCLTLNIWTPAQHAGDRLPVLVWAHGGGFFLGSGAGNDGEALARHGIVVVTLNYRLGALGFLAHPTLSRESVHGVSGNYGLLDQIAALRWVHTNIARFGGDPAKVAFGGQSAGALSAALLMVSPLAKGLFQRAILESPPLLYGPFANLHDERYGWPSQEQQGQQVAPQLDAIRTKSPDELVAQLKTRSFFETGVSYYPNVDGWAVPSDPPELLGTARQQKIPMIIGVTADEGLLYANLAPRTTEAYQAWVRREFPAHADRILARYPTSSDDDAKLVSLRVLTDFQQEAPAFLTARAASKVSPTFLYRFSRVSPLNQKRFGGAAHTAEIPYVFDHITVRPGEWEEQDQALSRAMVDAWVQFIKTGSPNGPGLARWPAYVAPIYDEMEFGDTVSVKSQPDNARAAFWAQIFEEMRAADAARARTHRDHH